MRERLWLKRNEQRATRRRANPTLRGMQKTQTPPLPSANKSAKTRAAEGAVRERRAYSVAMATRRDAKTLRVQLAEAFRPGLQLVREDVPLLGEFQIVLLGIARRILRQLSCKH